MKNWYKRELTEFEKPNIYLWWEGKIQAFDLGRKRQCRETIFFVDEIGQKNKTSKQIKKHNWLKDTI